MTEYVRPVQSFAAVTSITAQNASPEATNQRDLHRRITNKVGVTPGTIQYGTLKSLNTNERDIAMPDAVYAALVSAGVDFSDAQYNSSTARGAYANTSELPSSKNSGLRRTVYACVGDSITASDIGGVTVKLWANGMGGRAFFSESPVAAPTATAPQPPDLAYHYQWSHGKSRLKMNFGQDSGRIKNYTGMDYSSTGGKNWTDNFAQLKGIVKATKQALVFQIFAGTNDFAYADVGSNGGLSAVPTGTAGYTYTGSPNYFTDALIPFIALIKAEYPTAKILFVTPLARSTGAPLNGKFDEVARYAIANKVALGIDVILDTRQIVQFDCRTPSVTSNTTYYQTGNVHPNDAGYNILDPFFEAAYDKIEGWTPNPTYAGALA